MRTQRDAEWSLWSKCWSSEWMKCSLGLLKTPFSSHAKYHGFFIKKIKEFSAKCCRILIKISFRVRFKCAHVCYHIHSNWFHLKIQDLIYLKYKKTEFIFSCITVITVTTSYSQCFFTKNYDKTHVNFDKMPAIINCY